MGGFARSHVYANTKRFIAPLVSAALYRLCKGHQGRLRRSRPHQPAMLLFAKKKEVIIILWTGLNCVA